jgi:hypothetical protein
VALVLRGHVGLLRVRLGALGDGHHGVLGPDVDGLAPVQAFDAAALDGDDVFCLQVAVVSVTASYHHPISSRL